MASVFKRGGKKNRDGYYYFAYKGPDGKRKTECAETTNKASAERMAQKAEDEAAKRRKGLIDPKAEHFRDHEARPLTEHLDDLKKYLLAKGDTPKHANETAKKASQVFDKSGMVRISDLSPSRAQAAIGELRDCGISLRTCNAYRAAIKTFSRWLVIDGRVRSDELAPLPKYNADADRRYVRRDLDADELARLIRAAEAGPVFGDWHGTMTGPDRAMLYHTAAGTGFRANELRSLTQASFNLDADTPMVTVAATISKRRREDEQPIPEALAAILRPWLATTPAGEPVFSMPDKAAPMLRADLKAAGIASTDKAGRVVDFHSLRHGYISRVVDGGASVKESQELARHSDPRLTMGYAHTRLHNKVKHLENLPIGDAPRNPEASGLRATGTDDRDARAAQRVAQRAVRESEHRSAATRSDAAMLAAEGDSHKPLIFETLRDEAQPSAASDRNTPGRTRTPNLRIRSPPLYPIELRAQVSTQTHSELGAWHCQRDRISAT